MATIDADVEAVDRISRQPWQSLRMTTQDGLTLHARYYPASGSHRRTAVCLAGLTRNARDFSVIAPALASGPDARDVYCLDMRGRGESDRDPDWRNYSILVEIFDVQDFMTARGLHDVALIGTSRGGFIGMGLAATQPSRLGAVVLNDVGPVIDKAGLSRIAGYVGRTPTPGSWQEAADQCKRLAGRDFPEIGDDEWLEIARQWFDETSDGRPASGYDPAIAKTFADLAKGIPELWPQFEALKRYPVLTLRGELSDLLTESTVAKMAERHPKFRSHTVPKQGHAPLLRDDATIGAIKSFLSEHDGHRA